jgi:predicted RNase H-like nuclease (RuvC/YqgF family)
MDDFGSDHRSVGIGPVDAVTRNNHSSMRVMNSELERQIHELQLQNRSLHQKNREMMNELTILKSENARFTQVSKQLAAAQREVAELSQLLRSKEASISALDEAYHKLETDYKRLLDNRSIDADSLAAKQTEINRLQQELDQCKFNRRLDDDPPIGRFRPQSEEQPPPPPQQQQRREVPAAMRVNLCFGSDDSLARMARQIPVEDMSDMELKDRFESLSKEKEDKERQLNRAPPKGSNLAHVRRQKEELDNEIVKLGSLLSKVKLEMKRRGIY